MGRPDTIRRDVVNDVEWLVRSGCGREEIAERLARSWAAVEQHLRRAGRADLVRAAPIGPAPPPAPLHRWWRYTLPRRAKASAWRYPCGQCGAPTAARSRCQRCEPAAGLALLGCDDCGTVRTVADAVWPSAHGGGVGVAERLAHEHRLGRGHTTWVVAAPLTARGGAA